MNTQSSLVEVVAQAKNLGATLPVLRYPVALWYALRDPATPVLSKVLLGAALAYVLLPFDLLPDFLPGIGYADDMAVLAAAFRSAKKMISARHLAEADAFLSRA